jgi:threonine/homoserine/homoserine lactone efflux protein
MISGQDFGIVKSLPYASGMCLGSLVLFLLVGLGFGSVFIQFPSIHDAIKIIGSVYLLYLAWQVCTAHNSLKGGKIAKPMSFFKGVLFQWINPKIWTMSVAVFTTFIIGNTTVFLQAIIISFIFFMGSIFATLSWLCFGSKLHIILKNPIRQRYFNYSMGMLLAITVVFTFVV